LLSGAARDVASALVLSGLEAPLAAVFLGEATTEPGWDLFDLGPFPAMVAGTGRVHGELYEIRKRSVLTRRSTLGKLIVFELFRASWEQCHCPEINSSRKTTERSRSNKLIQQSVFDLFRQTGLNSLGCIRRSTQY
jgi:hypothetical protein